MRKCAGVLERRPGSGEALHYEERQQEQHGGGQQGGGPQEEGGGRAGVHDDNDINNADDDDIDNDGQERAGPDPAAEPYHYDGEAAGSPATAGGGAKAAQLEPAA